MFQAPDGIFTRFTLGESRWRLENASLPAQQAGQPDARAHRLDVRERLHAGRWIIVDQNIAPA